MKTAYFSNGLLFQDKSFAMLATNCNTVTPLHVSDEVFNQCVTGYYDYVIDNDKIEVLTYPDEEFDFIDLGVNTVSFGIVTEPENYQDEFGDWHVVRRFSNFENNTNVYFVDLDKDLKAKITNEAVEYVNNL